jgi:membrane-bound ClpP family serine protease
MEKQGNKVLGIVAIILGAIAIVTFYVPVFNIVSLICGIVGLILAILSKKSFTAAGQTSPVPTVGLVLSIIGLALAVIGFFTCTICGAWALNEAAKDPKFASELSSALNSAASAAR